MRRFAAAALATALHASAASPLDAEKISFQSVACRSEPSVCEKLTGLGYLFAKPGQASVVLISHGSQGIDARMYDYVDALQKEGFAAFVLDHWGPRGIGVTHHDYRAASLRGGNEFNMAFDSLLAAELLRARGFTRVGSIGESQGGAAAIMLQQKWAHAAIERNVSRLYAREFKVRPIDAVVGMSGYCGLRHGLRDGYVGTPFLFITGEKDDERGVTNLITGETVPGQNMQSTFDKCMARDGYHSGWWKDRFIAVPHWIGFFKRNL